MVSRGHSEQQELGHARRSLGGRLYWQKQALKEAVGRLLASSPLPCNVPSKPVSCSSRNGSASNRAGLPARMHENDAFRALRATQALRTGSTSI
jgi:hypothetical protein